ncbi:hypothetical protein B0H11DRAFT_1985065 [Mycena galericulata]|nr:hypothetical protein B0H11DRAFT_1985065 [Mycena galericulata]
MRVFKTYTKLMLEGVLRSSLTRPRHLQDMSPLEDRFRIPGGSLDLDFDDENGTNQVAPASSPEPPAPIQSIAHLNPAQLFRVLSCIPHPLASRTAEYVLALNLSGTAFRNLDASAFNILANHDPTMAEQLSCIKEGGLPRVPHSAAPIQNDRSKGAGDGLPPPETDLPDASDPPAAPSMSSAGNSAAPIQNGSFKGADDPLSTPGNYLRDTGGPPAAPSMSFIGKPSPRALSTDPSSPAPALEELSSLSKEGVPRDMGDSPLTSDDCRPKDGAVHTAFGMPQNTKETTPRAPSLPLASHNDGSRREEGCIVALVNTSEGCTPPAGSAEGQATGADDAPTAADLLQHRSQLPIISEDPAGAHTSHSSPLAPPTPSEATRPPPFTAASEINTAGRSPIAPASNSSAEPPTASLPPPLTDNVGSNGAASGFTTAQTSSAGQLHGAGVKPEAEASSAEANDTERVQSDLSPPHASLASVNGDPSSADRSVSEAQAFSPSSTPWTRLSTHNMDAGSAGGSFQFSCADRSAASSVQAAGVNDSEAPNNHKSVRTSPQKGADSAANDFGATIAKSVDGTSSDGDASGARGPADGDMVSTGVALMEADGDSPQIYHSSEGENGAPQDSDGPEDAQGTIFSIHVPRDDTAESNESLPRSETGSGVPIASEFTPSPSGVASTSSASSPPDPDTPVSHVSAAYNVVETPPAANISDTGRMDDPSFLEFDLLQFSPFLPGAQLHHDTQVSILAELFKDSRCTFGADTPDSLLITGELCEEQAQPTTSLESSESGQSGRSDDGFPFSCMPGSHDTTAGLRYEVEIENRYRGGNGRTACTNDDNSCESYDTKFGPNQPNQPIGSHADPYFSPRLGKAVDSRRGRPEIDNEVKNCSNEISTCITSGSFSLSPHTRSADKPPTITKCPSDALPAVEIGPMIAVRPEDTVSSGGPRTRLPVDTNMPINTANRDTSESNAELVAEKVISQTNGCELRPPLLRLSIPISPTSLGDELSQLSPLFSPFGSREKGPASDTPETSAVERLFSEYSFSVSRAPVKAPIKLKRGTQMRVARHSRGTDTSDYEFTSRENKRNSVDVSVQTDEDAEVENLRRRIKALERELRSLRAVVRRSEERVRESKPRSFWKKLASTDRVVPPQEPLRFGLLKDISWSAIGQESSNSGTRLSPNFSSRIHSDSVDSP